MGYSGGLDSAALLHRLASLDDIRARGLRALHVHHGLHADADAWATHSAHVCASIGVPLQIVDVQVGIATGLGREGAARQARHAAFAQALQDDEILALAHHRDDQAETFLLRALRGSGIDGLAAMQTWRAYGRGWLWRPLLEQSRDALHAYAVLHAVPWIEDPSNGDEAFDRNYLRQRVLPLLRARWPHVDASFARSAALAGDAADLLDAGDPDALASVVTDDPAMLRVDALVAIEPMRRARVLRRWIATLGLPALPAAGIARIASDLLPARPDTAARFDWHGASVRRWRGLLHAGPIVAPLAADFRVTWDGRAPLRLPTGECLRLATRGTDAAAAAPLDPAGNAGQPAFDAPLVAHARLGGERITLAGRTQSHALKTVMQARDVPPWRRDVLPLLADADGTLLAAGDVALSGDLERWLQARGLRLVHGPLP